MKSGFEGGRYRSLNIGVYVLGLDRHGERVGTLAAHLDADGIDFEFVAGFDGRNLEVMDFPRYDHDRAVQYMGRGLSGGEIGCYVGHENALRAFLASEREQALILEDDAIPIKGLLQPIWQVVEILKSTDAHWCACNVGVNRLKFASAVACAPGLEVYAAHYYPMTAHAVLWSRRGATEFLTISESIDKPVDNLIRHWLTREGHGYAVLPPLVTPSRAPSLIDGSKTARKQIERNLLYGVRKKKRIVADKINALARKLSFVVRARMTKSGLFSL